MQVLRDSPDWQKFTQDVAELKLKYGLMELNVNNLMVTQANQHRENTASIQDLKTAINGNGTPDSPGITGNVIAIRSSLETANEMNKKWRNIVIAALTLFIAAMGLWFTSLEFRGKVSKTEAPAAYSHHLPVDASNHPL